MDLPPISAAETQHAFESLGISLGLGLLVGLQRERAGSRIAGVRTFPLITMLGTILALLGDRYGGGWTVGAGLLGLVITVASANFLALKQDGTRGTGLTTEVTIVLMFALGAYAAVGPPAVVLAVGGVTFALLYLKGGLHGLATTMIGDKDMRAIMVFVAVAFIVFPVLPDQPFGPWGVWNPRRIWLVVVIVVGIGLGGYVAYKVFGQRAGTVLAGILGGVISSTATTLTYARRTLGASRAQLDSAMVVIVIASAITYPRIALEIAVTAPDFARVAVPPLMAMMAAALLTALVTWLMHRNEEVGVPEQANPTQARFAIVFAAVFAAILLLAAAGQKYLGAGGTYAVAAISGTTNLDAITLSNAQLVTQGKIDAGVAWTSILVAAVANLLFKLGAIAFLGHRRLLVMVAGAFAVHILAAFLLMWLWPASWVLAAS